MKCYLYSSLKSGRHFLALARKDDFSGISKEDLERFSPSFLRVIDSADNPVGLPPTATLEPALASEGHYLFEVKNSFAENA